MEDNEMYKPMSFAKGSLASTIIYIVESLLFIAGGVVSIIFSGKEWLQKGIFLIVGIFIILMGTGKLVMNFIPVVLARKLDEEKKAIFRGYFGTDMILSGAVQIIVGIIMIILFAQGIGIISTLMAVAGNALGVILLVIGGTLILFATGFLIAKLYQPFIAICYYVFSAILIGLGIFVFVYINSGNSFQQIILIIIGGILVLIGIVYAITAVREAIKAKKEKKAKVEETPIEVEAIEAQPVSEANITNI
ncbi:MAG: hypothetical protein MJ220_01430 [Bacilli bacterium]|nr:hypothetical protein [Bacilli bacterium]